MNFIDLLLVAGIAGLSGYLANEVAHQKDYLKCPTYETKYATWVGYVSFDYDEVRCFWLEKEYPRRARAELRVRQGLTE